MYCNTTQEITIFLGIDRQNLSLRIPLITSLCGGQLSVDDLLVLSPFGVRSGGTPKRNRLMDLSLAVDLESCYDKGGYLVL